MTTVTWAADRPQPTSEEIRAAMDTYREVMAAQEARRRHLAESLRTFRCPECGRAAVHQSDPDRLLVCRHVYKSIREQIEPRDGPAPLGALRVDVTPIDEL